MPPKSYVDVQFESLCFDLERELEAFAGESEGLQDIIKSIHHIREQFERVIIRYGNEYERMGQHAVDLVDRSVYMGIPSIINVRIEDQSHCKRFLQRMSDEMHELQLRLLQTPPTNQRSKKKK